jgi:hypothetical protein
MTAKLLKRRRMAKVEIFIGDVFSIPQPPQTRFNPHWEADKIKETREKYLKNISEVLEAQIAAFTAKSGDKKLVPHNCYVSCVGESEDVAIAMPETRLGIVTYWQLKPVHLKSGQAVFTSGW